MSKNPLQIYLETEGLSMTDFAKKFPVPKSPQYIWSIVRGKKRIGPSVAVEIEKVTEGKIKPAMLRPDLAEVFN